MRCLIAMAVAAVLAAVAGSVTARALRLTPPPPPASPTPEVTPPVRLTVPPSDLDFGSVWETDRLEWVVHVTNPGAEPVMVSSWDTSCNCHAVEPPSLAVAPGETARVKVSLNLLRRPVEPWTGKPREFAVRLRPVYADGHGDRADGWLIGGTVKPFHRPVEGQPASIRSELAQPFAADVFTVQFLVPVRDVEVTWGLPLAGAEVVPPADGETAHRIVVQWPDRLPVGAHSAVLRLTARSPDNFSLPPVTVPCRVDVVEDVCLSPPRLIVAGRDDWVTETVQAYSLSGQPVRVLGVEEVPADPDLVADVQGTDTVRVRVWGRAGGPTGLWKVFIRVSSGDSTYRLPLHIARN